MQIIPAIDLYNGKVVRLTEGDYNQQKVYDVELVEMIKKYEAEGILLIHIVDLNGAKGDNNFEALIAEAITDRKAKIQVGGGVRDMNKFKRLLNMGASRIILGTAAITKPDFLQAIANEELQSHTVIGIDIKDYQIMINGWQDSASIDLYDFINNCLKLNFNTFLCTDIAKDGKLEGPSIALYKELIAKYSNIKLIASGGVAGMADIEVLAETGVVEVVVGKAIYENRMSITQVAQYNAELRIKN